MSLDFNNPLELYAAARTLRDFIFSSRTELELPIDRGEFNDRILRPAAIELLDDYGIGSRAEVRLIESAASLVDLEDGDDEFGESDEQSGECPFCLGSGAQAICPLCREIPQQDDDDLHDPGSEWGVVAFDFFGVREQVIEVIEVFGSVSRADIDEHGSPIAIFGPVPDREAALRRARFFSVRGVPTAISTFNEPDSQSVPERIREDDEIGFDTKSLLGRPVFYVGETETGPPAGARKCVECGTVEVNSPAEWCDCGGFMADIPDNDEE